MRYQFRTKGGDWDRPLQVEKEKKASSSRGRKGKIEGRIAPLEKKGGLKIGSLQSWGAHCQNPGENERHH